MGACGDERAPPSACRSRSMKLRAVQSPVRECGRKAALTTPGRTSTARWCGSGKQHRTVYVRNQHLKAPQERTTSSNLADMGWVAVRIPVSVGRTLLAVDVAVREAREKACGVSMAKPLGHSWAPSLWNAAKVNVGTTPVVPPCHLSGMSGGNARRRPMLPEWGGGSVVVRGRESRPHGEGIQQGQQPNAEPGGR